MPQYLIDDVGEKKDDTDEEEKEEEDDDNLINQPIELKPKVKEILFAPPTTYILLNKSIVEYKFLGGELLEIPEYMINDIGDKPKEKDDEEEAEEEEEEDDENIINQPIELKPKVKEIFFLLSCLSMSYCDNYDKWLKIAIIIFNETNDYNLLDAFSKRRKKYNAVHSKQEAIN